MKDGSLCNKGNFSQPVLSKRPMRYSNAYFGRSIHIITCNLMWAKIGVIFVLAFGSTNMGIAIYVISHVFGSSESPDMGFTFTFAPSEVESGEPRGVRCRGSSWASAVMDLV